MARRVITRQKTQKLKTEYQCRGELLSPLMRKTMEIYERKYYLPRKMIKKGYLERNQFKYSRIFSDNDEDVYTYRFIVWKFGSAGTLEGEIRLNTSSGDVNIGCYDYGTRNPYASWYNRKYGKNEVVNIIDDKFEAEIKRLGIRYKNDNSGQRL